MWRYNYTTPCELYHYGVKGMKWGIRRTPEQLGHKRVAKNNKTDIIKTIISGHNSSPIRSKPNSVTDHIGRNGRVDKRSFYDSNGFKIKDIHANAHGNPKRHPYGIHGEHVHDYKLDKSGNLISNTRRELNQKERRENGDML